MEWFKKHVDTVVVISIIFSGFIWMNGKFTYIDKEISVVQKEMAILKTVMLMNGHYPKELASGNDSCQ